MLLYYIIQVQCDQEWEGEKVEIKILCGWSWR